jgi:hypothetical protein
MHFSFFSLPHIKSTNGVFQITEILVKWKAFMNFGQTNKFYEQIEVLMRKLAIFLLLIALTAFVSACEPASSIEPSTASPTATSVESIPASQSLPDPTATVETVEDSGPGCTVASAPFPSEPPENSTIPLVTADDWAIGPEDAPTTIIEYGDFQ